MESCKEFHIVTGLSNICVKCKLQLTNNEHLKVEDLNKDFLNIFKPTKIECDINFSIPFKK